MHFNAPRVSARWLKAITVSIALSSSLLGAGCGELDPEAESAEVVDVQQRRLFRGETTIPAHAAPYALRQRAATLVEQRRQLGEVEGAALGEAAYVYFRPDVEGPAYYEFEITREGEPAGFVLLSTGGHDHPVAHWSAEGVANGRALLEQAEGRARRLYKLDVFSYAAEGEEGEVVAQLGNLPQRQIGVEEAETAFVEHHATPVASDPDAEEGVEFEVEVSGEDPQRIVIEPFEGFDALKGEYAEVFSTPLDALRREAAPEWEAEALVAEYGEGIRGDAIYPLPLLDGADYEVSGPALDVVEVEELEGPGGRRLDISLARATTEELDLEITVHHPELGAMTHRFFTRPITEEEAAELGLNYWRTTAEYSAGASDDQRHYHQHQYNGCSVGCGAVAWGMLFGWGDKKADDGHFRWWRRWGLYRQNGGRGSDAVAPQWNYKNGGVENMLEELNRVMGTYCVINNQAATNPWDMNRAWRYLSGRTGTSLSTRYNVATIAEDYIRADAAGHIINRHTPAIIGTGFIASAHYPLAWKYRVQRRTVRRCFFWCWEDQESRREFYVNQGWGNRGNGWIPASTWFSGTIYPNNP